MEASDESRQLQVYVSNHASEEPWATCFMLESRLLDLHMSQV